ncbi:hypothetical protein [Sinorhizobium saheli]|uniref:Uncharacterized protein n=1 Tax=Sinorhizobium saheli TaxID=36856 RepID=A0A178XXQ8_SINSA|nr:hypothetical protein [Sinorhizobium saheli]MQW88563.1 hypothetical protein [Sinorhizobium saheli]OAP39265.1 hypothetical protein ATB98_02940 [Sinorhizobium saheli]
MTEPINPSTTALVAPEIRFQFYKDVYLAAVDRQFQYGKWVLASLLAVHAGSLVAISQAGLKTAALYAACGPLLIYGVGTTLVAGGLAWINFSTAMHVYAQHLKDIRDGKETAVSRLARAVVAFTLWGTPFVAALSLVLFFVAAARATDVLKP